MRISTGLSATLAVMLLGPPLARATRGGPDHVAPDKRTAPRRTAPGSKEQPQRRTAPPKQLVLRMIGTFRSTRGAVTIEHLHVEGPLAASAARSMINGLRAQLEACFPAAGTGSEKGGVALTLQLTPQGKARAALTPAAPRPPTVDTCLRAALENARWPTQPAGSRIALRLARTAPAATVGGLIGEEIPAGAGGLGLRGTGKGGGGVGFGTIGVGTLGTIGHGSGSGSGFGRGLRRHGPAPRIQIGAAQLGSAALPKEVVRRVVRRHLGQLRYCYERHLLAHPAAVGTVRLRFVIDQHGNVTAARVLASTFKHDEVPSCLARLALRWRFPRPRGGAVTVVYPFTFQPADERPAPTDARNAR